MKTFTFAFFKFQVPKFKQFLWYIALDLVIMSESYREAKAVLDIGIGVLR